MEKYPPVTKDLIGREIKILQKLGYDELQDKILLVEDVIEQVNERYSWIKFKNYAVDNERKMWACWTANYFPGRDKEYCFELIENVDYTDIFDKIDNLIKQKESVK